VRYFRFAGVVILLFPGRPLYAASTWTGNPTNYQPVTANNAVSALDDIRSRALSGQLTEDDIVRASALIKSVRENTTAPAPDITAPPPVLLAPVSAVPLVYGQPNSGLQIPIDDSANPLGPSARKQLVQTLNSFPLKDLRLVKGIQIAPGVSDPDLGSLFMQTKGGNIALYGQADIPEALEDGVAAVVYDSLRGSPQQAEWNALGDFGDFVQSFTAWMDDTTAAFEAAEDSESPADLSKVFFMANLFTDDSTARTLIYNPTGTAVPWQVHDQHFGFGPYSFDVSDNQIVHLAYNGESLGTAAATIPSQWFNQGLGN